MDIKAGNVSCPECKSPQVVIWAHFKDGWVRAKCVCGFDSGKKNDLKKLGLIKRVEIVSSLGCAQPKQVYNDDDETEIY